MKGNANEFPSEQIRKQTAYRMELVLLTIVDLVKDVPPGEGRFGHPCSRLITRTGQVGARTLASELLFLQGTRGEYSLNGQGLKLYWNWHGPVVGIKFRIGGDQQAMYPKTVSTIKKLITDNGWGY